MQCPPASNALPAKQYNSRKGLTWTWPLALVGVLVLAPGCGSVPSGAVVDSGIGDGNVSEAPGGGTAGSVVVDSDGDGFSDDVENNSNPGTDPFDATDNPNNVRDTDGDGCSDYDELTLDGFCDNDPNTPGDSGSACDTTYYNSQYLFGFDLPPNPEFGDTINNEGNIILASNWAFVFEGQFLGVQVIIGEDPGLPLADWVTLSIKNDEQLLEVFPFNLADGTNAYFNSVISPLGLTVYTVDVIANGYAYRLSIFPAVLESVPTDAANAYMLTTLDSLCVGNLDPSDQTPDDMDNCPNDPDKTDPGFCGCGVVEVDFNDDGIVDACGFGSTVTDSDADGIPDDQDNCPVTANPDQLDSDGNGLGDACDFVLPPTTLTVSGVYGSDALELSDGSVWEVTLGFTFGWFVGDRVVVDSFAITNLDESESVSVSQVGTAIAHGSIWQVSDAGRFVDLLDGTSWEVDLFDRLWVQLWLPANPVVVVQDFFSYSLVRESDGRIVGATPVQ